MMCVNSYNKQLKDCTSVDTQHNITLAYSIEGVFLLTNCITMNHLLESPTDETPKSSISNTIADNLKTIQLSTYEIRYNSPLSCIHDKVCYLIWLKFLNFRNIN